MAKPVEFQMTDSMTLQKMIELFGRRMRVHDVPILFGKNVIEISPSITEISDMTILLQSILGQRFAKTLGNTITSSLVRNPVAPCTASAGEIKREGRSIQQSR